MTEKKSALYSHYIIDGVRFDMTPAELLDECMEDNGFPDQSGFGDIVDELTEPPIRSFVYEDGKEQEYISQTTAAATEERQFRMLYPEHFTKLQVTGSLMSRLWSKGHFKLGDLRLWAQWEWDTEPVGNMSAFYRSVEAASGYIYGLGVKVEDYLFIEEPGNGCNVKFYAWLQEQYDRSSTCVQDDRDSVILNEAQRSEESITDGNDQESALLFKSSPYESRHPWISEERACHATIQPDEKSWIIYIPFDTCSFKLGGSLLTQVNRCEGDKAPELNDPDYFIDCYEVVRELVEDGLVMAGINVADGGLATAAARMCSGCSLEIDIRGILASYQDASRDKILFGDVPGIIMQISDEDYDYVDSQLLLQDVAYYPLGHPSSGNSGLTITESGKNGVENILASLLNMASEGED